MKTLFQLTEQEFVEAAQLVPIPLWKKIVFSILQATLVFMIFWYTSILLEVVYAILIAVCFLMYFNQKSIRAKRVYRTKAIGSLPNEVEIGDQQLIISDTKEKQGIEWNRIATWRENNSVILLELIPRRYFALPKRSANVDLVKQKLLSAGVKQVLTVLLFLCSNFAFGQTCPGSVTGTGTRTAKTCEEAYRLAEDAAVFDADEACPDNCRFITTGAALELSRVSHGDSCTVTVQTVHICTKWNNDDDNDGDEQPDPNPGTGRRIVVGVGLLLVAAALVFLSPGPPDEIVVGGVAIKVLTGAAR